MGRLLVSLLALWIPIVISQEADFWLKQADALVQEHLSQKPNTKVAKNIILFIGDGLSIATVTAARIFDGQRHGASGEEHQLSFERLKYTALVKTYCTNKQIPDSACTATAIASGVKTKARVLGLDDSVLLGNCSTVTEKSKLANVLKWAQEAEKATGVVTTTRITHATPAAFYAHSAERDWEDDSAVPQGHKQCKDIARQLIEDQPGRDLRVILGGGRRHFIPKDQTDIQLTNRTGRRTDDRNLIEDWVADKFKRNFAYNYVWRNEEFNEIDPLETDFLLGLFDYSHLQYDSDRNNTPDGQPSLARMVNTAIKVLQKNKKGYFLLVEGGRIDHAHHQNHARYALEETVAFSHAVSAALKMVNLEETLVLVTADHAHSLSISGYSNRGHDILDLAGTQSDIDAKPYTTLSYAVGPGFHHSPDGRVNQSHHSTRSKSYKQPSTVPASSAAHDGEDVLAYGQGPMAHLLSGAMEQNALAYIMAYAGCLGPAKRTQSCVRRRTEPMRNPDSWMNEPQGEDPSIYSGFTLVPDNLMPKEEAVVQKSGAVQRMLSCSLAAIVCILISCFMKV